MPNMIVTLPICFRFIYVPSPHTHDVIGDEFYESLVDWNLDEKVSTTTLDNCTTNDSAIPYLFFLKKTVGEFPTTNALI
jgi:hypothetical protein